MSSSKPAILLPGFAAGAAAARANATYSHNVESTTLPVDTDFLAAATDRARKSGFHDEDAAAAKIQAMYRGRSSRSVPLFVRAAKGRSRPQGPSPAGCAHLCTRHMLIDIASALTKLVLYLLLGGLVYGLLEPTFGMDEGIEVTGIDAVYFSVATFTTVGYGDLAPTTTGLRVRRRERSNESLPRVPPPPPPLLTLSVAAPPHRRSLPSS